MGINRFIRWRDSRRSWKTKRKEEEAREAFDIVAVLFCLALMSHLIRSLLE